MSRFHKNRLKKDSEYSYESTISLCHKVFDENLTLKERVDTLQKYVSKLQDNNCSYINQIQKLQIQNEKRN